jgi:hypothetical protein
MYKQSLWGTKKLRRQGPLERRRKGLREGRNRREGGSRVSGKSGSVGRRAVRGVTGGSRGGGA